MEWLDDVLDQKHWKDEKRGVHFKEGDIVRIRQWDDMAEEFGTDGSIGSINCCCAFTTEMKPLCGLKARLLRIDGQLGDASVVELKFLDKVPEEHRDRWSFSTDMIELAEPKNKFKEGDIVRIRQWDDMAGEFDSNEYNIECLGGFAYTMKPLCGLTARIIWIGKKEDGSFHIGLDFIDDYPGELLRFDFHYSTDMIEPAEGDEIIDVEPEELQPVTPDSEDISELLEELGGLF